MLVRDDLQALLESAQVTSGPVGADELTGLWALLGLDDAQRLDEFLDAVAPWDDDGLPLRVGRWQVDLAATAVRTGVLTALVSGC